MIISSRSNGASALIEKPHTTGRYLMSFDTCIHNTGIFYRVRIRQRVWSSSRRLKGIAISNTQDQSARDFALKSPSTALTQTPRTAWKTIQLNPVRRISPATIYISLVFESDMYTGSLCTYLSLLLVRQLVSPLGTRNQTGCSVALACFSAGYVRVEPGSKNLDLVSPCQSSSGISTTNFA